jgi:N-acetylglucosaminyl-diphospho-decaprenol L-rhamnosyltransferase
VKPELSVIVINWNTRDLLTGCLQSLWREIETIESPDVEVFVVDNGSTDGSAEMVRERFPRVRLIENAENIGFSRANNQALALCQGRYVILLNSDAIVQDGSLRKLVTFADAHPGAGIIGAKLVNPDGSFQAAYNDFPTPRSVLLEAWGVLPEAHHNPYYPSSPPEAATSARQCDWVGGACLMARSLAIDDVGLLDESFFMYSEEVDWCYRMRRHGWEVWYTPDTRIVHLGSGSAARRSQAQRLLLCQSKMRFLHKHCGRLPAEIAYHNYRLASLVKAFCSNAGYLLSKKPEWRVRARFHWRVAWELHRV